MEKEIIKKSLPTKPQTKLMHPPVVKPKTKPRPKPIAKPPVKPMPVKPPTKPTVKLPRNRHESVAKDNSPKQGEDNNSKVNKSDQRAIETDGLCGNEDAVQHLLVLLDELSVRERQIICLRFGLDGRRPKTLQELSYMFHLSRERIRQIQNQAIVKLCNKLQDK